MNPIGIVGAGTMGCTVGAKFVENGIKVFGFDSFPSCVEKGHIAGLEMCSSLSELAGKTSKVILFLPGPTEIEECVCGDNGLLKHLPKGSVIIDMCTSSPECTRQMAEAAAKTGVDYIDAPVLGRPATVGKWALPVGGSGAALETCRPYFDLIAAHVVHMGEFGSGHVVKLLNQLMFGAINAMTAEMMAVSEKVGVPPGRLYDIITASQAGTVSNLFKELGRRVSEEEYDNPTFTVRLLNKDVRLGVEMAEKAGAPVVVGRSVDFLNKAALAQGFGEQDSSVMWKGVKNFWKGD